MPYMDAKDTKRQLRKQILAARKAIAPAARQAAEATVAHRVLQTLVNLGVTAGIIALYEPMGSELDVAPLAAALRARGYRTAYPLVLGAGVMTFGVGAGMAAGPARHFAKPAELAALIVPGVAFDAQGFRLGQGGGYYDRYLPLLPAATPTIGVAYSEQLLPTLPHEPHDVPLTTVITPSSR
jgi:5-formyltetrahydrofolate cyclo-ligase